MTDQNVIDGVVSFLEQPHLNLRQVAKGVGVSRSTLQNWVQRKNPPAPLPAAALMKYAQGKGPFGPFTHFGIFATYDKYVSHISQFPVFLRPAVTKNMYYYHGTTYEGDFKIFSASSFLYVGLCSWEPIPSAYRQSELFASA